MTYLERKKMRTRKMEKERMVFLTPYRIRREQDSKCGVMKIPSFLALNSMIKDRKIMTL